MMYSTNDWLAALSSRAIHHKLVITLSYMGFIIILLVILGLNSVTVAAQQPIQWVHDQQVPDYLDDTFTPYLLADQNHTVHVFANQWVGDEDRQLAIVYRQWNLAGGWTKPVDVLLSPDGEAQILGAFLDSAGLIHVAFWGGAERTASIYYSSAPAANADHSPAWSVPALVGEGALSPSSGALAGDEKGNLVIIYTGNSNGNGVYAIHSTDTGQSWSEPIPIFLTYNPEQIPFSLRLNLGYAGGLHATWNVVDSKGVDVSSHYARYDVAQGRWSDPVTLETRIDKEGYFGPSYPVLVDNGESIVVMYNSGSSLEGGSVALGRPVQRVRLSNDGGQTWGDPLQPFPHHLGRSGEHALVVDSNNVVHTLFVQRIESLVNGKYNIVAGIWHSTFEGNRWSDPDRIITTLAPHDVRAVISQGNILLVVWREDPGSGQHGIWYSYTTLNAPELAMVPLPTVSATPTATPLPTATPVIHTPTPSPRHFIVSTENTSFNVNNNPADPFIVGVVLVVLVLIGIVIVYQLSHSRRY